MTVYFDLKIEFFLDTNQIGSYLIIVSIKYQIMLIFENLILPFKMSIRETILLFDLIKLNKLLMIFVYAWNELELLNKMFYFLCL